MASVSTQPKPVLQQAPVAPKASREERAAYNKEVAGLKEAAELAVLQAEVDADVAAFKARGVDWSKRLSQLHVPQDPPSPVSSADAFGAPKYWGGLRDLLLDKPSKLGICPIEKVASSELKKLMLRMMGDPKWRDEPWFKGGIHKVSSNIMELFRRYAKYHVWNCTVFDLVLEACSIFPESHSPACSVPID